MKNVIIKYITKVYQAKYTIAFSMNFAISTALLLWR